MTIKPMTTEYLAELKALHDSGIRHARQCWNIECEPNWKRVMAQPAAFHNALRAEWDRLSVYGRHQPGHDCFGRRYLVDIETGAAQTN